MFCKWCGKTIQTTDKKCPSCGRETPPMSDCGGFYNLKHSNGGTTGPTTEKIIVKEVPYCAAVEKMEAKYARERKAAKTHHTITMLCFGVVLIAIVCTAVLAVRTNSQLGEIKEQIGRIQTEVMAPPMEDTASEPAEEQQTADPIEPVPQSFVLDVTIALDESTTIVTSYDFGDYAKTANITTEVRENEKGQEVAVSFNLADDTAINLELVYIPEETGELVLGAKCYSSLSLFANQDFTYKWQYRSGGGIWTDAEAEVISHGDRDYVCFVYNPDWLKSALLLDQPIELRCSTQIENDLGDSMLIMVDGISIVPDDLLITNEQQ